MNRSEHRPFRGRSTMLSALVMAGLVGLSGLSIGQPPAQDEPKSKGQDESKAKSRPSAKADPNSAPIPVAIPADWTKLMSWRSIGPANMGGRITALSVFEADPTTYWVATAGGGLLKTINNGTTFEHQFDREATVSIGDVCVAPSDRNIVWVGTGEANPRNSVSYGDGVYKSTDGGKNWKHMGLRETFQISKVIVHPKDPNTVYVGALGRLYGPNGERGVYKTTDGGTTWDKSFFIDERTGIIDMIMHPTDPNTLIAAAWERWRDGFDSHPGSPPPDGYDGYDPMKKWGPGAGLYKTVDGGKNWKKLEKGLPTSHIGRVGLDWYRKDPNVVFAIVDCAEIGKGPVREIASAGFQPADAKGGARLAEVSNGGAAATAGLKTGDIVRKFGDKEIKTAKDLSDSVLARKPGDKVKLAYSREGKDDEVELTLGRTTVAMERDAAVAQLGLQADDAEEDQGAKVRTVARDGAADKAGLKADDVITRIGDKAIKNNQELLEAARNARAGDKVKLEYLRDNEAKNAELTYTSRPVAPAGGGPGRGGPGGRGGAGPAGGGAATRPYAGSNAGQRENVQDQQSPDGHKYGGVYKSTDGGESWQRVNSVNPRPMYFSVVRVDPSDDKNVYVLGVSMYASRDGGKTFRTGARGTHSDQHALWIDPKDGRHAIVGTDGGFYVSYDRMATWDHMNHAGVVSQFYHVAVSTKKPYWVFGGLQDNGSWGGPSVSLAGGGPINEDWINVGGGDGFVCRVDPNNPDLVYAESQGGAMSRYNLKTGERASTRPIRAGGAGGRAGAGPQAGPAGGGRAGGGYRFNWNAPFILSSHNSQIFYSAGNVVFRSVKQGADAKAISPEITRSKRGSATALAESPRNADVLWVGTDDGGLWVTRDGGQKWAQVDEKVGLPGPRCVATIEASRFVEGRAYVAFDAHRSDDDKPYAYVTDDFGQTWKSINANLPEFGSTRCLREDISNANLLFCGTEFALFASIDRGASWTKLNNNLPTVAVHEVAVHPTAGEIVAATHGRGIWILDVTALRQMTAETVLSKPALYQPNTLVRWQRQPTRGRTNRAFVGQNPPTGAQIYYSLPKKAEKVALEIFDVKGEVVSRLTGSTAAGLHRVTWDVTTSPPRAANAEGSGRGGRGGGGSGGGAGRGGQRGGAGPGNAPRVLPPGTYRVVLTVDGQVLPQTLIVEGDPNAAGRAAADDDDEDDGEDQ